VTLYDPRLWWHPFGPITKNVPLIVGTALVIHAQGKASLNRSRGATVQEAGE
jgi:hypothetical protein